MLRLLCNMLRKPPFSRVTTSTVFLGTHTYSTAYMRMAVSAKNVNCM